MLRGLKFVKGGPLDVSALINKGNVVLLEFWATWCPPCRTSIPHLTEIARKYKDKGLTVIGITNEDEQKTKAFVTQMGSKMDYNVVVDSEESAYGEYMNKYNIGGIPHAFLISQGQVQWKGHPMEPDMGRNIEQSLANWAASQKPKIEFKNLSRDQISALSVKELKSILEDNQVNYTSFLEKTDYVDAVENLKAKF